MWVSQPERGALLCTNDKEGWYFIAKQAAPAPHMPHALCYFTVPCVGRRHPLRQVDFRVCADDHLEKLTKGSRRVSVRNDFDVAFVEPSVEAKPSTLHPTPYTLHPKLYTLNPTPKNPTPENLAPGTLQNALWKYHTVEFEGFVKSQLASQN